MSVFKLLIVGVLCIPTIIFCQPKNRISVQTGLIHYFFDKSPLMNFKYKSKVLKPFNGILINSIGLDFSRKINSKYHFSIESMYFYESYRKNNIEQIISQVSDRGYLTFNLKLTKYHSLKTKWNTFYGFGLAFRFGNESVIVNAVQISGGFSEINAINCNRSDIGLNGYFGYEYKIFENLSVFSKLDFIGFIYMNDRTSRTKLKEIYNIKGYPSRYDLSLKIGVSFNF